MFNNILSKPMLRLSVVIFVNENILKLSSVRCKDISHRYYARWSARKPSKAFTPEDISSGSLTSKEFYESEYDNSNSDEKKTTKYDNKFFNEKKKTSSSKLSDYEVLDEHDATFSKLMTLVGNRKMRRKHDMIMLEGKRLNMDALQAGLKPKKLFFTEKSILEDLKLLSNLKVPLYKLPYKTVELWSKLDTPPGIVGFYNIPRENDISTVDALPIKVVCDNVRDPGNLGSIIRVAASVGCTKVLLMRGCTDPWDSKVLRSASGGHFHIPIQMDLMWHEQDFLRASDHIYLADSHMARSQCDLPLVSYHDVNFSQDESVVVIIGGETEGLSNEALQLGLQREGSRLFIPLSNCMESLNSGCALSVILFEIKRQFLEKGAIKNDKKDYSSDLVDKLVSLSSRS